MVATFTVTEGRSVSMGVTGTKDSLAATWEKEYFVDVSGIDPALVGDDEVLTASGLPTVNQTTYSSNGRIIPFIICRSKKAIQHPQSRGRWTVSCEFKSPENQSGKESDYGSQEPPVALSDITPHEVPIFGEYEKLLYEDHADDPVVIRTPSGGGWREPVMEKVPTLTLQITQYEASPVLYSTLMNRLYKVNDDTYRGEARYKWMIIKLEPTAVKVELAAGLTDAVVVTYHVALSPQTAGWKIERALYDTKHFDGTIWKEFQDGELRSTNYGPVDSDGYALAGPHPIAPQYVTYEQQPDIDFGSFLQA